LKKFGKEDLFYKILEQQAVTAHRAALAFLALAQDFEHLNDHVCLIEQIEHEGDELTHQLANKVDATFVTPLDKEDLRSLSGALDDITDHIEAGAARAVLYQLKTARPDLVPLINLLVQITDATVKAVQSLSSKANRAAIHDVLVTIHRLENVSDKAFRQALGDLFNSPCDDPIMVIKWKEIYDRIEIATDKCEDVANMVESVVVKYA